MSEEELKQIAREEAKERTRLNEQNRRAEDYNRSLAGLPPEEYHPY